MAEATIEAATLAGRLVRLEPPGWQHRDDRIASGIDPEPYRGTVDRLDRPEARARLARPGPPA